GRGAARAAVARDAAGCGDAGRVESRRAVVDGDDTAAAAARPARGAGVTIGAVRGDGARSGKSARCKPDASSGAGAAGPARARKGRALQAVRRERAVYGARPAHGEAEGAAPVSA